MIINTHLPLNSQDYWMFSHANYILSSDIKQRHFPGTGHLVNYLRRHLKGKKKHVWHGKLHLTKNTFKISINKLARNASLWSYTLKHLLWMGLLITLSSVSIPSSNVIATAALATLRMPQAKGDICLLTTSDQMTNGRQRCRSLTRSEALPICEFQGQTWEFFFV